MFIITLVAVKLHDKEVTVGDLLTAVFLALCPVLNVFTVFTAIGTLLGSKWWYRAMSKKLF